MALGRPLSYLMSRVTLHRVTVLAYCGLCYAAIMNFRTDCLVRSPDSFLKSASAGRDMKGKCVMTGERLGLRQVSAQNLPSIEQTAADNPHVRAGGIWSPDTCKAWQKVAIVIPYRDRWQHLKQLLSILHPMLQKQQIHYQIFLVEQAGTEHFNRGKIKNVGYLEAIKQDKFDCVIMHDVDLLPEHDKNYYMCNNELRHLSAYINEMQYRLPYYSIAGGVIAINTSHFARVNGFSNSYWRWGDEDDDFSARVQYSGIAITRPAYPNGRYKMIQHTKDDPDSARRLLNWRTRWPVDGLNDPDGMRYTVLSKSYTPLYTNVTVDVGRPPRDRLQRYEQGPKEGLLWLFKFYLPCDIIDPEHPNSCKHC